MRAKVRFVQLENIQPRDLDVASKSQWEEIHRSTDAETFSAQVNETLFTVEILVQAE
jgi:hypothetical protein